LALQLREALAATGATLVITARDVKKAETILVDLLKPGRVSVVEMDNSSFASIRAAATTILAKSNNQVNILVNSAGVMGIEALTLTVDGHEMHFSTLLASSSPDFHSRVVNVASPAHRAWTLNESDNHDFQKGGYRFGLAYAHSKLASVYMANELDRRYAHQGLQSTSLHPGAIDTDLSRHLGPAFVEQIMSNENVVKILKSVEQGAATTVLAAVGKEWEGKGGKYLEDCEEAKRGVDDNDSFGLGYVRQTYDPMNEERLWKDSLKLVGVAEDM